jgi:hypothetical protein
VGSVAGLGNDVSTLFDLQAKLVALDAKESTQKALAPLVILVVALVLALAAFTVGLFGLGELISTALTISQGASMLLTAGATLVFVGGAIAFSIVQLKASLTPFRRSIEELDRNVAWLKTVLLHSGRTNHRRGWGGDN